MILIWLKTLYIIEILAVTEGITTVYLKMKYRKIWDWRERLWEQFISHLQVLNIIMERNF